MKKIKKRDNKRYKKSLKIIDQIQKLEVKITISPLTNSTTVSFQKNKSAPS